MSNVNDQIAAGLEVIDVEGTKVGTIIRFDKELGYFETEGTFTGPRYIPFWAIADIAPPKMHLNVTRSVVSDVYQHMPEVTPDLTSEGRLAGSAKVQSGATGRMVPLDAAALRIVKEQIEIGTPVLDADNKNLGTVEDYDDLSGYMLIEKEGLTVKDVFLPVTTVSYLDEEGIHLSEAKETLMTRFSRLPQVARDFYVP